MTITQRIAALNGGVSQRPQSQRDSGQADAQTNALNHPLRGLMKRPPLAHFGKLTSDLDGIDEGFAHAIDLSPTERFIALVRDGAMSVFDKLSGTPVEVVLLDDDGYVTPVQEEVVQVLDSFTDVNATVLSAHSSAFVSIGSTATEATIQSNVVLLNSFGQGESAYRFVFPMPSADYTVQVTSNHADNSSAADVAVVFARIPTGSKGGYAVRLTSTSPNYGILITRVSSTGVHTTLATLPGVGVLPAGNHRLAIRVSGTTISALLDGVVAGSTTDATYSAAGHAGLGGIGNSSGGGNVTLDDLTLTYTPTLSGVPPFKAVQVGKQTVIANTTVTVTRGTESAPNKAYQALVAIRQADYGTQYKLTINDQIISFGSPEGVTPQARVEIDTTAMAGKLEFLIGTSGVLDEFEVTRFGSSLLIERTDGSDFSITADDGLADNGLVVVKGSVQSFADLPSKGPDGFIVEVTGDASNEFDNYFVRFDVTDTATYAGVWKECVKPGEIITLDAATLPHVLTYKGSFIPESEAAGTPPAPTIVPSGGVEVDETWDATASGGRGLLHNHGDHYNAALGDANGIETTYTIFFDVDTRNADKSNLPSVLFKKETGGIGSDTWEEVARYICAPETLLKNQSLSGSFVRLAGERISINLEYADGVTPADGERADIYTAVLKLIAGPGGSGAILPNSTKPIVFIKHTGRAVKFEATRKYPQGALIRITCDGVNFDYTPATDVTGTVVATTLKTTIDAHATFVATNPSSGEILVVRADAADPVVSAAITWSEATTLHDPDQAMTVSGLVGEIINNLTDNSTGTITANTATTITVASLTGGADNSFQAGDKVEVVQSSANRYFTFGPAAWAEREAGDLTSNPMPSFVDQKVNDVFITKGRLGFVSGGNIVMCEAGRLFNVFRTTVVQLLDGDPIDVKPAHGEAIRFHSHIAWDGRDLFWSSRHQFELSGEPVLSPRTVKLLPISEYPNDAVRPVVLGRHAFFVSKRQEFSQVYQYGVMDNQERPQANHLTRDVSQYLDGTVLAHAGDEDLGMYAILTDADRSGIYVLTFDREIAHFAWSRWQFPATDTVVGLSFLDGQLIVLTSRSDGFYLDTCDVDSEATIGLLDRHTPFSTGTYSSPNTTWTLPYSCATNGSEGTIVVVNAATGALITCTRPTATTVRATGDFSATAVVIGIQYTFSHTLSTIFPLKPRGDGTEPIIRGRLQLSRLRISYENTRDFTVAVTPGGRAARTYTVDEAAATDGTLVVPVLSRNTDVSIVISSTQPNACRLTDVEWEGNHYSRSRTV